MRFEATISLLLALLLWDQIVLSVALVIPQTAASLPFQLPLQASQHSPNERRLLKRLRDGIIEKIWRIPVDSSSEACHMRTASLASKPPSKLLARYGGDVVLRFNIQSAEEAKALSEAANILFLDVWEFTSEWADVRLARDVVCLAPTRMTLNHDH